VDAAAVQACAYSEHGLQLERAAFETTSALHPRHTFVPWLVIDGSAACAQDDGCDHVPRQVRSCGHHTARDCACHSWLCGVWGVGTYVVGGCALLRHTAHTPIRSHCIAGVRRVRGTQARCVQHVRCAGSPRRLDPSEGAQACWGGRICSARVHERRRSHARRGEGRSCVA
jgi:hypothetical protein